MIDQHNTLAEKFLKKGFWLYLFSFIIAPIGYIIKIILSGELAVDEIGIIYGVMSLMILLSSFNDFGMAESLNKFIPDYITNKDYAKVKSIFFYAISTQILTGTIIFLIFYFGADFLSTNYFHDTKSIEIIKIFSFFFLGNTFFHVITTFFQAIQNTFMQKMVEFIRMIFVLGYTVFIFLADLGNMASYSLAWVFGMYIGIIFAIFIFYKKYYKVYLKNVSVIYSKDLIKEIFKYAFLVFLGAQAGTILSQVDMQMIIYILGNTDAGYYTNYLSIIGIPFMIIGPIFAFLFPVFSEMIAKKEFEKIKLIKQVFTKNFLSFSIVFSILFLVFGLEIASILFGDKFIKSGEILQYSILFLSFNFLLQINFNILAANGKVKERLYIILIALIFNSVLNYILLKTIGVVGAALATGLGWVLIYILSELKLKEYFTKLDIKYLFKNIIIFSVLGLFMYKFIVPIFGLINNRLYEFGFLTFISIIYFGIYFLVNIGDFRGFISEIKKVRKK